MKWIMRAALCLWSMSAFAAEARVTVTVKEQSHPRGDLIESFDHEAWITYSDEGSLLSTRYDSEIFAEDAEVPFLSEALAKFREWEAVAKREGMSEVKKELLQLKSGQPLYFEVRSKGDAWIRGGVGRRTHFYPGDLLLFEKLLSRLPELRVALAQRKAATSLLSEGPAAPPRSIPILTPTAPPPAAVASTAESQARAVAKYPALRIDGSSHNATFVAKVRELRAAKSPRLDSPTWPEEIADETAPK